MNLPKQIFAQLELFTDKVRVSESHTLAPQCRQNIYSLIGAVASSRGPTICGWLGVLSAQRVLPVWEAVMPYDSGPSELINLSIDYLCGKRTYKQVRDAWKKYEDRFGIEGIAELSGSEPFQIWRSALAASTTIFEIKQPHPFLNLKLSENDTDQDIDPWSHDVALWAVECEAGAVWENVRTLQRGCHSGCGGSLKRYQSPGKMRRVHNKKLQRSARSGVLTCIEIFSRTR